MSFRANLRNFGHSTLRRIKDVGHDAKRAATQAGTTLSGVFLQIRDRARGNTIAVAPQKTSRDFAGEFHKRIWLHLHSVAKGTITPQRLPAHLVDLMEEIKSYAEQHALAPELEALVNALTQAVQNKDGRATQEAFLDVCVELYRVKNGIDESALGESIVLCQLSNGPERLLYDHYAKKENSSRS